MNKALPISLKDLSDKVIGFPDYAKADTIFGSASTPPTSTNPYTINSNGYLLINVSVPGTGDEWHNVVLYIDGKAITIGNYFTEKNTYKLSNTGILLPVLAGSSIYIAANGLTYDVVFIPMVDLLSNSSIS